MAIPSVYINLEDDVSKITTRLKHQSHKQVVLVCPKRCFLFSDSINLRLLKKQADILGKEIFILTMDEKGQQYAKEAGFQLKFLPKTNSAKSFSDVKIAKKPVLAQEPETQGPGILAAAAREIKQVAHSIGFGSAPIEAAPVAEKFTRAATAAHKSKPEAAAQEPKIKVTETVFPSGRELSQKPAAPKSHMQKIISAVVAASLILILLLVFVILPKATVIVYAKTEPVTRDMEISMSAAAQAVDASKLVMPATLVDETINQTDDFQSQGKQEVGNRASGTVKIYNFTKSPLNLKAATTVLTVGGKTYTLLNDVTGLKPTTYSNAQTKEVNPNSLGASVAIIASQGGEDYNLPQGTRLEITNQVFGSKPQFLYAVTDSEINGGTTRYLSVISQDDVTAAQSQLQDKALAQIRDKLAQSGLVLADGAYAINSPQFTTDSPVGTQTPGFQASLQAKLSGLAFKKSDLMGLIFQRIDETLDSDKTLQADNPDQTDYKIKSLDLNNELGVFEVHFEGQAVYNVDLPNIAPELVNKSQDQVNEILRSKASIDRVDITLAPSWQKNFPLFASKIHVSVGQVSPSASQ